MLTDMDPVLPLFSKFYFYPGVSRRVMMAELNMTAVSCFAPVWNSSVYIEKSVVLNIKGCTFMLMDFDVALANTF